MENKMYTGFLEVDQGSMQPYQSFWSLGMVHRNEAIALNTSAKPEFSVDMVVISGKPNLLWQNFSLYGVYHTNSFAFIVQP